MTPAPPAPQGSNCPPGGNGLWEGACRTPAYHAQRDDDLLVEAMNQSGLLCPFCRYDLRAAVSVVCPECGRCLTWKDFQDDRQMPNSRFVVFSLMGISAWFVASLLALLPALVSPRIPPGLHALVSLADFAVLCASAFFLFAWTRRPRRLLAYTGGVGVLVRVLVVPAGALLCVAAPATLAWFFWLAVRAVW